MDYVLFLQKAEENLKAAQLCFNNELFNASANRAYYAMYHAAIVALANEGIVPTKEIIHHDWVQASFAGQLAKRRKIYPKLRSYLQAAQIVRDRADYDVLPVSRKVAQRLLHKAGQFVDAIKRKVDKNG